MHVPFLTLSLHFTLAVWPGWLWAHDKQRNGQWKARIRIYYGSVFRHQHIGMGVPTVMSV